MGNGYLKAEEVAGGTNMAGIDPAIFTMRPGMRMRYDRPAADIADCFGGYLVYVNEKDAPRTDHFLPALPDILISVDAAPIAVTIRRQTFDPIPKICLVGPTNHPVTAVTCGGVMIGISLTPIGWSRMFRKQADGYRNRVVPLSELTGLRFARALGNAAAQLTDDRGVAPMLDRLLRPMLDAPHPDEPLIRRLMGIIASGGDVDIVTVAEQLDMPTHRLRRLALRHFGFPPKMLLTRARFLRSLMAYLASGADADYSAIDPSYFDASHFLRDANTFLGMTPRRLAALDTPYLDVSLRARAAVLGSPTQVLQPLPDNAAPELLRQAG